ncbi:MAG: CYTH domain-containing protein [Stomatobaculum sp.]|nr:CYTH domain-containing protein [Stomatobaculum sp.]
MEIERKFVPEAVPGDLDRFLAVKMVQGYLCTDPVVRVRQENDKYVMTYKGAGLMAHEEYNLPLTEEAFLHLLPKCDGRILQKTRYKMPVEGYPTLTAELDLFSGELEGLVILEVEFPSLEEAVSFVPPAWYGKDVTEDPAYHNSAISRGADPRRK